MNYIVFDLEWNQCPEGKGHSVPQLPFEVLEIGAIKLNSDKQVIDRFHEYIRPVVYKHLHFRTREIIHLSMTDLQKADPFPEVIDRFRVWCGDDVYYCSWGSLDLLELQRNMRYHKVENFFPFPLKYYDLQKIFSLTFEDGKSRQSLENAVHQLALPTSIPFHEALSDAWYTAHVMQCMTDEQILPYYSFDYFRHPLKRKDEIYVVFDRYSKFISMDFASKTEAMRDRKVCSTRCYLCGRSARKKIRWFASGGKNFSCLAFCEEHGYLKGKIRMKKTENSNRYFCVKTIKLISEEQAGAIFERQELLRERRRLKRCRK